MRKTLVSRKTVPYWRHNDVVRSSLVNGFTLMRLLGRQSHASKTLYEKPDEWRHSDLATSKPVSRFSLTRQMMALKSTAKECKMTSPVTIACSISRLLYAVSVKWLLVPNSENDPNCVEGGGAAADTREGKVAVALAALSVRRHFS